MKFLALLALALGSTAHAESARIVPITIDVFPYVATLGSNAEAIEGALLREAKIACGNLENVSRFTDVQLDTEKSTTAQLYLDGKEGSPNFRAVLRFAYPHVQGSANVECKQ